MKTMADIADESRSRNEAKTNADHIRSMTDEELSEFLYDVWNTGWYDGFSHDKECVETPYGIEWLKQPYKEEA